MGRSDSTVPADIIIGSGPAGVAAASALLERGRRVLLLDAGATLDLNAAALRERLGAVEPANWSKAVRVRMGAARRTEHTDSMRLFGSDFLFRAPAPVRGWGVDAAIHALRPSFARGGLSNGWGASVLPYRQEDIADWPITIGDLNLHYRQVARLANVTNHDDGLAAFYPVLTDLAARELPVSRQARELVTRLERRAPALADHGVRFGLARHAVSDPCRACGQCLHGCPYRLIFNAGDALDRLLQHPRLEYRAGALATRFAEERDAVRVTWGEEELAGSRLFIAGGVLPTARLVLSSLDAIGRPVRLLDSALSYLPALHRWSAGDPAREASHALSQVFIEIDDAAVDPHTVHTQVYTWNDTFAADMRQRFAPFQALAAPLIHLLSRRLIVAQTFLHSDASGSIELTLGRDGDLRAAALANPQTPHAMTRAVRAVGRTLRGAGVVPLPRLRRDGGLGSSFHCGGTFPMRAEPQARLLETDTLGRPAGLSRVHLLDASVFPSIPASTITFSVMANAHRIAANAPW